MVRFGLHLLALLAGCGQPHRVIDSPPARPAPAPAGQAPVVALARQLPRDPAYLLLAPRVGGVVQAAREAVEPLRTLQARITLPAVRQWLDRSLGIDLLDPVVLDRAGVDLEGPAAVFGQFIDGPPTVVASLADRERLQALIADRSGGGTHYVRKHRGVTVRAWPATAGRWLELAVIDDLLALQLTRRPAGAVADWRPSSLWIEALLDARRDRSASVPIWDWLREIGGRPEDTLLAYLAPRRIDAPPGQHRQAGCRQLAERLGWPRLGLVLSSAPRRARLKVVADLSPAAHAALGGAVAGGVALPPELWRAAVGRLRVNLAPDYLRERLQTYGRQGCGPLFAGIEGVRRLVQPLIASPPVGRIGGRVALVLLAAEERGRGAIHLKGALAGRLGSTEDRAFFRRRWQGFPRRAGEPPIWRLAPPALAGPVDAAIDADRLLLSAGESVMSVLLGERRAAPADSVISAELRPARISDLRAPLALLEPPRRGASARPARASDLDALANFISSFRLLRVEGRLEQRRLVLELEAQLR